MMIDSESADVIQLGRALVARGCEVEVFTSFEVTKDTPFEAIQASIDAAIPFKDFESIRAKRQKRLGIG
jgi:hypothetical protein